MTLHLQELLGEGEDQTGALTLDATYLLPVTITNASVPTLDSSSTVWYVIKRSSNITTAAQLTDNWINFPTLDKDTEQAMALNNLTAVTYEALIYIDKFATSALNSAGVANPVSISTIMGVEDYLLLRIGDTNFERQQLQFDGSGSGSAFGKFPGRDAGKILNEGVWYHIACTYDQATRTVRIFVNGELQSEGKDMGLASMSDDTRINLAMRAFYDRYLNNPTPENEEKYGGWADARQFFISYSYDAYRPLNGKIAEARVWSVARKSRSGRTCTKSPIPKATRRSSVIGSSTREPAIRSRTIRATITTERPSTIWYGPTVWRFRKLTKRRSKL